MKEAEYEARSRDVAFTDIVLWIRGGKASPKLEALLRSLPSKPCFPANAEPSDRPDVRGTNQG